MATFLLTWNPNKWHWDDLQANVEEVAEKGFHLDDWSTGVSKRIRPGDRLFLIRLGKEPKGIMGSGYAESSFFEEGHWDKGAYAAGKSAKFVHVRFDALVNPELHPSAILPRKELDGLGKMHWDSQSSGIQIPDDVARRLEDVWAEFLRNPRQSLPTAEPSAIEGLKTETLGYARGRSRRLRDLALKQSGGICCACDVDYSRLLDGKGVRVLQVHHRKQLAATDAPRLTRLSDLAVVCANCHMLIHMNPMRALSVESLKGMLSASPTGDQE